MKKYFLLFFVLFAFSFQFTWAQPEVTTSLQDVLAEKGEEDLIPLNIRLSEQYDDEILLRESRRIINPDQRREFVINELKTFSEKQQAGLLAHLQKKEAEGKVEGIRPYWIANFIHCKASPSVIQGLMARKDLARLDYDKYRQVLPLEAMEAGNELAEPDQLTSGNPAWNVTLVNADQVWDLGYTGEDIVVAVLDTGVNPNHQDLQGNMWQHIDYPGHGYNFVEDNHNTMDNQGHGTHCAGTVAGNGTAGTATGMAPAAKIMNVKVLSSTGGGTESGVWAGIQFSVDYGARIMSLSLGWMHQWGPDRSMWRTTMNNARSAGLIATVASGNEGGSHAPPPSEVRTPGDVPPPWLHPDQTLEGGTSAVVSVGSTTNTDALSSFSSKGPVTWQGVSPFNDYPYNPGMGLIRPDLVAPGSDIISLTHNSNTGYTTKSGTSMATPAVAGVMALMLSKNPLLTPEEINQVIEESALPLSANKSNSFGSGRLDALEAILATPFMGIIYSGHEIDDSEGNDDGKINPGELIKLNMTLENPKDEGIEDVEVVLRTTSPYITITDSIASFGDFQPEEFKTKEGAFTLEVSDTIPGEHTIKFTLIASSPEEADVVWTSSFQEVAFAPRLEIASLVIDDSEYGNDNGMLDPGEIAIMRFKIENNGQIASDELEILFEIAEPYVSAEQTTFSSEALEGGESIYAEFEVEVHENIAIGSTAHFSLEVESGHYQLQQVFPRKIGLIYEDWSSGNFSQFNWQFSGMANWYLVSDISYEGYYSARSGLIGDNHESVLFLEFEVLAEDSISFYRKVSSQNNRDHLEFYIDEDRLARWSGEEDWEKFTFMVEPGMRTFKWVYKKGPSGSAGNDCAWIDMIVLPAKAMTTAFAGFDQLVCGPEPVELQGYASLYDESTWHTDGDGTFDNPHDLNTIYTPGAQDLEDIDVTLTLEVTREGQDPVLSHMSLTVAPEPEVDLGDDLLLCMDETALLDAGEGHYAYEWFDGSQEQTFLVNPEDFEEESVDIWVIVYNEYGCEASDTIHVVFDDCVGIHDPADESKLSVYPNPAGETVNIDFISRQDANTTVSLYSYNGQKIRTWETGRQQGPVNLSLNLGGINPGVYFLKIENREFSATRKLIIQ